MRKFGTLAAGALWLGVASPVDAEDVLGRLKAPAVEFSVVGARYVVVQPPTQRSGGRALWYAGWSLAAAGGTLAALSNGPLANDTTIQRHECDRPEIGFLLPCKELNKGAMWVGIGLAGAGIAMAILGKPTQRAALTFTPMQGGGAVFRRVTF